jgi:hypothetical protein
VLRYELSIAAERTGNESEHSGPVFNCGGEQDSTNCVEEGSATALTPETYDVVNRTLVSIEELGPEEWFATDNYNSSLGELQGSYRGNQDKIWQIRIPQGCQLWIWFEDFNVEPTDFCDNDYFSVQTSKSQTDIRKYCRNLESITIQRRRRVQLWFHAGASVERRGIFARFCFNSIVSNSTQSCDCNQGDTQSHDRRKRSEMRGAVDTQSLQDNQRRETQRLRDNGEHSNSVIRENASNFYDGTKQSPKEHHQQRVRQRRQNSYL